MLWRECNWNLKHDRPKFLGWTNKRNPRFEGKTHCVCRECTSVVKHLLIWKRNMKEAGEWQRRKDAGAPPGNGTYARGESRCRGSISVFV